MKDQSFKYLDHDLWVRLRQVSHLLDETRTKELKQFNLSVTESAVLLIVPVIGKDVTPAEISRQLFREPHTMSKLISQVVKKRLLTKTQDLKKKT